MEGKALALKKISKAMLLAFVLNILAAGILSVFVYFMDMPEKLVSSLIITVSALCIFFGGVVLAKNIEKKGLLNGLMLGLGYVAVLLVLSLTAFGEISFGMQNITRCICILAAAMLGGVTGINTKKAQQY